MPESKCIVMSVPHPSGAFLFKRQCVWGMSANRKFFFLVGLAWFATGATAAAQDWPPIIRGVWHVRAVRTSSNGKVERWERTVRRCEDPTILFQGYWGTGRLDRAGCQFDAAKTSSNTYRISSECMLIGGTKSLGIGVAMLNDDRRFHWTVRVTEGRIHNSAIEEGKWLSRCTAAD